MNKTAEDRDIIRKIITLYRPFLKNIVVILICMSVASGINVLLPFISKLLMNNGLLKHDLNYVVRFSLISMGLILVDQMIGLLETKYYAYINALSMFSLNKKALKHIMKLKQSEINKFSVSELLSNLGMDISNIASLSDRGTFVIIMGVFRIIGGIIGLLLIDIKLTVLVLSVVPLKYFLTKYLAGKRRKVSEKYIEYSNEFTRWYGDVVGGLKEIKLWGLYRNIMGEFIKKQRKVVKVNIKLAFIDKINELSESVLFQLLSNTLYIIGAYLVFKNKLTVGDLFAFITYSVYVTTPISAIMNLSMKFSTVIPSAKRFFNFMNMETEGADLSLKPVKLDLNTVKSNIKFENVFFSFKNNENTLKNVSFEIEEGEKVAILGANGSGKSTIINLITRFYVPDKGRVLFGGVDIKQIDLNEYRRLISVVFQAPYIFDSTIRNNILLNVKINDFTLNQVSKMSQAYDFISKMEGQYENRTGVNGSNLSGGERQKIAVARALAKNSKLLILDEATSNYDITSETNLNSIIETEFKEKTVILISHRPDILKRVDKIILLDDGGVQDIGKHEHLYENSLLYRNILDKVSVVENGKAG